SDQVTSDLFIGTNTLALVATNLIVSQWTLPTLVASVTYKWQVLAKDSKGSLTTGPILNFTTVVPPPPPPPPANNPPSPINLSYPENGYRGEQGYLGDGFGYGWVPITGAETAGGTITLTWEGGDDPDSDAVIYAVFAERVGTSTPSYLERISTDTSGLVLIGTTSEKHFSIWVEKWRAYNWRVEAFDTKGSKTISSFWKFKNGNAGGWPIIDYPKEEEVVPNGTFTLRWHYVSPDGDRFVYNASIYNDALTETIFRKELVEEEYVEIIGLPSAGYCWSVFSGDGWGGGSGDAASFVISP
ncbi:MAG: hypothetical protein V1649_03220, partial [Patescibacteria group bacterium]